MPTTPTTRRQFIAETSSLAAAVLLAPGSGNGQTSTESAPAFSSAWQSDLDRVWLGADYWANPLQDWRVKDGQAECIAAKPNRNVHVLTRELADRSGDLRMTVKISRVDGGTLAGDGKGSAGFKIGILGTLRDYPELRDYRNNLAFSSGWDAGLTAAGGLFFGDVRQPEAKAELAGVETVLLELAVTPKGGAYHLHLKASDAASGKLLGSLEKGGIRPNQLIGNVAIGCNFGPEAGTRAGAKKKQTPQAGPGNGRFAFNDWTIAGSKLDAHEEHRFGPVLFNHYTLSGGILKMTVQMPPLGTEDSQEVRLEVQQDDDVWRVINTAPIDPHSRTATFRISEWDDTDDVIYRVGYTFKSRKAATIHHYSGTIRRDPRQLDVLSVADISCNIHTAFPNAPYVASVARLNPDLLAFVGDQFYESTAGYGVQRDELEPAILDYLRKWYFHGWTWRDLTKDRPSVSLPDDHDVYQGNLWGEGGAPQTKSQEAGGYQMPAPWVNVVHRTQTSHHPDPYETKPCKQGILNYYGAMTYGGVSFAILADRQFKSAPEGKVPPTDERADHVINPDFDPSTADVQGLELLGGGQLQFLRGWVRDWNGARMKAVISQTIFTGMATTHGGERQVLRADYDQNGWPQTARNEALRIIRKAHAFHIAGDQHLPAVVHYGIDEHRDAGVAFAGPAVNTGYPRWWEPTTKVNARKPGQGLTGDFTDHFGHPMTVLAVKNGAVEPRKSTVENLADKSSGFGMVRFNKRLGTIVCECWPFGVDFSSKTAAQFDTWPVSSTVRDQYGRRAAAQLPKLNVSGADNYLVEVLDATTGDLVYGLRLGNADFQPHTFKEGLHTLRISVPETGRLREFANLKAEAKNSTLLEVDLA